MRRTCLLFLTSVLLLAQPAWSWALHGLITTPAFEDQVPGTPVRVESLESFITAEAPRLEQVLADEELWARRNLRWHVALAPELAFKADCPEPRRCFAQAIRINPAARLALYLELLPGQNSARPPIDSDAVSIFKDDAGLKGVGLVALQPHEAVLPLEVLSTASDEPDLGLDVGLFSDNRPCSGQAYGFGRQPFGNPNLYYGSQAPFHMGYYHENPLIAWLGSSLKQSYAEMRIHQCQTLARLAFASGHDYWGWRFTGWGLHYLGDLCQPYHARALPGLSPARMAWLEIQARAGRPEPMRQAIQLTSNRHLILERLERSLLEQAYLSGDRDYVQFKALRQTRPSSSYTDQSPRSEITLKSSAQADHIDALLVKNVPQRLVNDPDFEFDGSAEEAGLLALVRQFGGETGLAAIEAVIIELLQIFSTYGQGYLRTIREPL